jgi:hypothetical protein
MLPENAPGFHPLPPGPAVPVLPCDLLSRKDLPSLPCTSGPGTAPSDGRMVQSAPCGRLLSMVQGPRVATDGGSAPGGTVALPIS